VLRQGQFEPVWEGPVLGIGFQLLLRHLLEEFIQVHVFTSVNPLAGRVDLGVRLNRCHDGRGRDINLTSFLDNPFESGPHVALALRKQSERMSVTVDASPIVLT